MNRSGPSKLRVAPASESGKSSSRDSTTRAAPRSAKRLRLIASAIAIGSLTLSRSVVAATPSNAPLGSVGSGSGSVGPGSGSVGPGTGSVGSGPGSTGAPKSAALQSGSDPPGTTSSAAASAPSHPPSKPDAT